VADDVALHLRAGHHLLHVAAAYFLQRRPCQRMNMPGLRVHRRRRAFCDFDDLLDYRAGDLLLLEAAHTFARLHECFEFHSSAPAILALLFPSSWPGKSAKRVFTQESRPSTPFWPWNKQVVDARVK
jgi:hypothetical protein